MSNQPLGRLERVDLGTDWKNETTGFTPWLAREENLQSLDAKRLFAIPSPGHTRVGR